MRDADGREQRLLVVVEPASCSSRGGSLPVQEALAAHSSSACLEVALHASRAPFVMENACTGSTASSSSCPTSAEGTAEPAPRLGRHGNRRFHKGMDLAMIGKRASFGKREAVGSS